MNRSARMIVAAAIGGIVVAASAQLGLPCYIAGPTIDCVQCKGETGNLCGGNECNTTVTNEVDISTTTDAGAGQAGRRRSDAQFAGDCWRTVRYCDDGTCVTLTAIYQTCHEDILGGGTCTGDPN